MNHARTSLLLLPQVLPLLLLQPRSSSPFPSDGPPCQIIHSLLYCITLWTRRWYHSSGMSAVSFSPCIICIYLPCSLFLLPKEIVCLENVSTVMHPEMSANKGFIPGGERPGPTEDLCPLCIFHLKTDPKILGSMVTNQLAQTAFAVRCVCCRRHGSWQHENGARFYLERQLALPDHLTSQIHLFRLQASCLWHGLDVTTSERNDYWFWFPFGNDNGSSWMLLLFDWPL